MSSKRFKKLIFCLLLLIIIAGFAIGAKKALAQGDFGFEYASELDLGTRDLRAIIMSIINIFLGFLGIIAIVIIMYGGYVYMTSAGDPQKIETAKKILVNGAIGLAIILMSWGIVMFLFRMFGAISGDRPGGGGGTVGPGALGSGIIESHYPARNQREVPRNTMIAITFKEAMQVDTICAIDPCLNVDLNTDNIKIFKNDEGEIKALTSTEVRVSTKDNKTFVFDPVNYLGNPINNTWYTVSLADDIKKADGNDAFTGGVGGIGYYWQFEVSTKVDLTPPQVESIIPYPDNDQDTYNTTPASQATGSIAVVSRPNTYITASVDDFQILGASVLAEVNGYYSGEEEVDDVSVYINFGKISAYVNWGAEHPNTNLEAPITDRAIPLGSGLTLLMDPGYDAGNEWTFDVHPEVVADYLKVGSTNYKFVADNPSGNQIVAVTDINETATNIAKKIKEQSAIQTIYGIYGGADDKVTVIINSGDDTANVDWSVINVNDNPVASIVDNTIELVAGLYLSMNDGFKDGDGWMFDVTINTGNRVDVVTDIAGKAGDSIAITTDSEHLSVADMSGGENAGEIQTCEGKCDEPRNIVVQINFNEAVDPMSVTGVYAACQTSDDCNLIGLGTCNAGLCSDGTAKFDIIKAQVINGAQLASGDGCSDDLDCLSGACDIGGTNTCVGDHVSGKYVQSNGYKTVEFVTFDKCGVNSCGDDVYCLPADANIKVKIGAAALKQCADNSECTDDLYNQCTLDNNVGYDICQEIILSCTTPDECVKDPYNICNGVNCEDVAGRQGKNSPQATDSSDPSFGVDDMARNSLDGNSDGEPIGPEGYYNENNDTGSGDSYLWSFWTNNNVDLSPPLIEQIHPSINGTTDLKDPIEIKFSKLMMSSTLKPDSGYEDNKEHVTLVDDSINKAGYWISSKNIDDDSPPDNIIDKTRVYINHTSFTSSTNYSAGVSEGVKDLYQNCYMPAADDGSIAGSTCAKRATPDVFCCNGVPTVPTLPVQNFKCP